MSIFLQRPGINAEIKTPFRWYAKEGLKNKNRKNCRVHEETCGYRLITPYDRLLPFQFYRDTSVATITRWEVFTADGVLAQTLDETIIDVQPITGSTSDCDYILYDGSELSVELQPGYYYSEIEDSDGNIFYSEDFYVVPPPRGSNLVQNYDFNTATNWTTSNATIAEGNACNSTDGPDINLQQSIAISNGIRYRVKVIMSSFTEGGTLSVGLGGTIETKTLSDDTELEHIFYITAGATTTLYINFTGAACFNMIQVSEISEISVCYSSLSWTHDCNFLGNIYYPSGFENRFYLEIGVEPIAQTPNIIREYDENGNKDKILRRQRRETTYKLQVGYIPWYVADALVEMAIHDNISLNLSGDLGTGTLKNVEVEIDWDEFGENCLALCNISFQLDDATVTDGCCDDALIPPISVPCSERFCDPELDNVEAAVTDFSYTDAVAIDQGLSVDEAPVLHSSASFVETNQICVVPEGALDGETIIDFTKTLIENEKYQIVITIDSISTGEITLYQNGVLGATMSTPGTYTFFFQVDPGTPNTRFELRARGTFIGCFTLDAINVWVPCMHPNSYGWLGYEDGLICSGTLEGTGALQVDNISSNYVYEISFDYAFNSTGDCFIVKIGGDIVATVNSSEVPLEGTYTFTYDPRNFSELPDTDMSMVILPCDPTTSFFAFTGIRMCGTLY